MGTVALPAPRQMPATVWEKASMQKNRDSIRHCFWPMAKTAGSLLNREMSWGPKKNTTTPMHSAASTEASRPKRQPAFTRSSFPAPMFWPMKVVRAREKQVMGRNTKPSTLA